jgi:hypothetical protein
MTFEEIPIRVLICYYLKCWSASSNNNFPNVVQSWCLHKAVKLDFQTDSLKKFKRNQKSG